MRKSVITTPGEGAVRLTPGRSSGKPTGGREKDPVDMAGAEGLPELPEEGVCPGEDRDTVVPRHPA